MEFKERVKITESVNKLKCAREFKYDNIVAKTCLTYFAYVGAIEVKFYYCRSSRSGNGKANS